MGEDKVYLRGVTYGTFARGEHGHLYPSQEVVRADMTRMTTAAINAIRTYTRPPRWLLDLALEHGIWVMAGTAWEQHVDFLADRSRASSIERRVRADVAACAGHPALLCHTIGNEIPARVVRWIGRRRVERFVERLQRAARSEDPGGLVTYVNYPTTEYLQTPGSDLACFNVYLESADRYDAYLARLQNIAGDRPLVMTELGLDSRAHGKQRQAESLDWQVRGAFAAGCAGTFVFSWTDDWHVSYLSEDGRSNGSVELLDWDFGLTDRDRRPKPALSAVRAAYAQAPFPRARNWPRVSVVVCTFNGARTLERCLGEVERLDYPDLEAIVVDDGSTDETAAIAARHACRLISTPNQGLANARNTGMRAASGEIVAYLDDDAHPDRDWLRYLVATMQDHDFAGAGGPNLPPAGQDIVGRCVGESPGGPIHVLLSDREAEHIPGCNMAFVKKSLAGIGGFDPQFRVAGDDVDICWRLREAGHSLGFSPAALVWHERRGSVRAFLRQQRGYGAAEALLERKWPDRYGPDGHARWLGRLYGHGLSAALGRAHVYYGTFGSQPFQALYGPSAGALSSMAARPEWHVALMALAALSVAGLWWPPLLAAMPVLLAALLLTLMPGARAAMRASFMRGALPRAQRWAMWGLTTLLHVAQPPARLYGRARLPHWRSEGPRHAALPVPRTIEAWSERWRSAEDRLSDIERGMLDDGTPVVASCEYQRWDLQARGGLLGGARLRLGLEEHGGGRQLVRFKVSPVVAPLALVSVLALIVGTVLAAAAGARGADLVLGLTTIVVVTRLARDCSLAVGSFLANASHGGSAAAASEQLEAVTARTP